MDTKQTTVNSKNIKKVFTKVKKDLENTQEVSTQVTPQIVQIIEKEVAKEPNIQLTYSRVQLDQIKDVYAKGASDIEFANFIIVASRTGLDIFKRQIYLIPRWDSKLGKEIFTPQTGIDGYRSVAERTQMYAGNDDAIFQGELELSANTAKKGEKEKLEPYKSPEQATVTVYKIVQGVRCPFTATTRWTEYYPGDRQGMMWRQKPHVMLAKCAEALALRKAFPNNLGGLYTAEEMAMQDAQIKPIAETKTVNTMFEKAKAIISKKTDIEVLEKDRVSIEASDKYNQEQKEELVATIVDRIIELKSKNDTETLPKS